MLSKIKNPFLRYPLFILIVPPLLLLLAPTYLFWTVGAFFQGGPQAAVWEMKDQLRWVRDELPGILAAGWEGPR